MIGFEPRKHWMKTNTKKKKYWQTFLFLFFFCVFNLYSNQMKNSYLWYYFFLCMETENDVLFCFVLFLQCILILFAFSNENHHYHHHHHWITITRLIIIDLVLFLVLFCFDTVVVVVERVSIVSNFVHWWGIKKIIYIWILYFEKKTNMFSSS